MHGLDKGFGPEGKKMKRLTKGVAALAVLLTLAGCGTTTAPTPTAESKEPVDEVAEFGKDLATLLNQGKSHELFNLWSDKKSLKRADLEKALLPDAKAKGIKWEYKEYSPDSDSEDQIITLRWRTSDQDSTSDFYVKKEQGKWRLRSMPFGVLSICSPFSVDETDAPVVSNVTCPTRDGSTSTEDGQTLLMLPGEHSLSVDVFDDVFDQPYQVTATPAASYVMDFESPAGSAGSDSVNLAPEDPEPAAGYADAVKAAFAKEASDVAKDAGGQPDLFDGITVTPTSDFSRPDVSGTYRHWADGGYQDRDISELSYSTTINWTGFVVLYNEVSRP